MFGWFQALLPKQGNFFALFEAHAQTLTAGADKLVLLLRGGPGRAEMLQAIFDLEHEADDITREVLMTVRRTFLTPFDRSAITDLITSMDDAIDQMNATAKTIEMYGITDLEPEMLEIATMIAEAARVTVEAIGLLREVGRNAGRLHDLTERLITLEGAADVVHDAGIAALFKKAGDAHPMRFIVGREIYTHLERSIDRFEDVANEIQGLVIDHA